MKSLKYIMVITVSALLSNILSAQGDLLVTPVRVIFEGNKQIEEINLVNIGEDSTVYSVSFLQYRMTEEGNFELIENSQGDEMFADEYLRIFPRRIKLAPREAQVIRMQLRRKTGMQDGEYRSHLYFRAEKEINPLSNTSEAGDEMMNVQITPVFGISIPVIIRNGNTNVTTSINDLNLRKDDDGMTLDLTINRDGNISVYGDILAEYIPSRGKAVEIGSMRGVAIYTGIDRRHFSVKIGNDTEINPDEGKIRVRFTSPKDKGYKLYSEKELELKNN